MLQELSLTCLKPQPANHRLQESFSPVAHVFRYKKLICFRSEAQAHQRRPVHIPGYAFFYPNTGAVYGFKSIIYMNGTVEVSNSWGGFKGGTDCCEVN